VPITSLPPTASPTTIGTTKPVICSSELVKCNVTCANLRTDNRNCGFCGTECAAGQFCLNGLCMKTCSSGQTSCVDGCFDLQTDLDHCGTCLNNCPAGLICFQGQCTAPATPMINPL
jgi:hypothetical protein